MLTPSERRRRFLANIRRQAKRRGDQLDAHVAEVLGTLVELQQRIRLDLAGEQLSLFDLSRLPLLQAQVDQAVDRWTIRARAPASAGIDAAWALGPDMIDGPLAAAEASVSRVILPESLLKELRSSMEDRITAIGPLAKERIGRTLRTSLLGGKSTTDALREIGETLKDPGPFRLIAFRAELVYRTEMGRVQSFAGQRRLEEAARRVPGLGKQWLWSGRSRATHQAIDGQVRAFDEQFDVGGEKLRFPRDPEGSLENTALCACQSIPHKDDW